MSCCKSLLLIFTVVHIAFAPPQNLQDRSALLAEREQEELKKQYGVEVDQQKATPEDIRFYLFLLSDVNMDSFLDGTEIVHYFIHNHYYSNPGQPQLTDEQIIALMDPVFVIHDWDGDGRLNYAEFVSALNYKGPDEGQSQQQQQQEQQEQHNEQEQQQEQQEQHHEQEQQHEQQQQQHEQQQHEQYHHEP